MKNRIAVHTFWDLILPVQRGKPGTEERKESNREIEEVFNRSKYKEQGLDLADVFEEGGYYTTSDFRVERDKVIFKGSDGKEYSVSKHWVVFEAEHHTMFEIWGERERR